MIDRVLGGRYRLLAVLGRGGMATVYRAEDTLLGREVAIKLLTPALAADPEFAARFEREARSSARLNHPNVVHLFDVGGEDEQRYIVMELVEGDDLKTLLERSGPLPPGRAARLGTQLADALAYAHGRGLIHRDVKPQNILVDADDRLKVTDFGIAHAAGTPAITQAGFVMGSVPYMAPEQARGEPPGPAADIYSAGVVLFEMLTGRSPYTGSNPVTVALQKEQGITEAAWAGTRVPRALRSIVDRATAPNPRDRFPTAADLRRSLQDALEVAQQATRRVPVAPPPTPVAAPDPYQDPYVDPYAAYDEPPILPARPRRTPTHAPPPGQRGGVPWPAVILIGLLLFALAAFAGFASGGFSGTSSPNRPATATPRATEPPEPTVRAAEPSSTPIGAAEPSPTLIGAPVLATTPTVAPGATEAPTPTSAPTEAPTTTVVATPTLPPATPPPATPTRPAPTATPVPPTPTEVRVAVPQLVGLSEDEANAALQAAGLAVQVQRSYSNVASGKVIAQEPQPGTPVAPGASVSIAVSKGPEAIKVPNVVGQKLDDVQPELERQGFRVTVDEKNRQQPRGTIVDQKPQPGEVVRPGGEIHLTVAR